MSITFTHCPYPDHHMYYVNLSGWQFNATVNVTVTATASVVRTWLYRHPPNWNRRGFFIVGLGVQWTPGARAADPPADTLQLCVGPHCLIYQLSRAERVPPDLRDFLQNPTLVFVGFRNCLDWRMLQVSRHMLSMNRYPVDISHMVSADLANAPLEVIVERYLGFHGARLLRREVSMSDWRAPTLSHVQVLQASIQAYFSFHIAIRYFSNDS